jgi:ATP-dependent DNA ligase
MKEFVTTMQQLESTSSRNDKIRVLQGIGAETQGLFYLALNPYLAFKIQKIPSEKPNPKAVPLSITELCETLSQAPAISNGLKQMIVDCLAQYDAETQKYLSRVLLKNLRCGVEAKTFNLVFPGAIPSFDPQLAAKFDFDSIKPEDITFPTYADIKWDGYRCLIFVSLYDPEGPNAVYLSKEGREFTEYSGLFNDELIELASQADQSHKSPSGRYVFDGEVTADTFQNVSKSLGKKNKQLLDTLKFRVYAWITGEEWESKSAKHSLENMYGQIRSGLSLTPRNKVVFGGRDKKILNWEELEEFYNSAVRLKQEGIMIKNPTATYQFKRTKDWIKWKPEKSAEGIVICVNPGESGKKYEHTLGSITVEGQLENGQKFRCKVQGMSWFV